MKCNWNFGEYFGWGLEAKAFSWCVVETTSQVLQVVVGEAVGIGAAGNIATDATPVHVFNAAFLPGAVPVAEVGLDVVGIDLLVPEERGAICLGLATGAAPAAGVLAMYEDDQRWVGAFAGLSRETDKARAAFLGDAQIVYLV